MQPLASATVLPRELTALGVAPNGHLFACDWSHVMEMDQLGNLLNTWSAPGVAGLVDIDVDRTNRVAAASVSGEVFVGDTSMTSFDVFMPRAGNAQTGNVAFVQPPVPEPQTAAVVTLLLVLGRRSGRSTR